MVVTYALWVYKLLRKKWSYKPRRFNKRRILELLTCIFFLLLAAAAMVQKDFSDLLTLIHSHRKEETDVIENDP
jgi:hypothetical protein